MLTFLFREIQRRQCGLVLLALFAAVSSGVAAQEVSLSGEAPRGVQAADQQVNAAKGTLVTELGKAILYVFHAKDNTYWFGSDDRGVYHYDGRTLVNFTTDDGLVSNRIRGVQEDKRGNIYFTTYEGISKFDGRAFETLTSPTVADASEWKLQPDDLWFVGPPDAGVVFRYDGITLYRLQFPTTKLGDQHFIDMPRSKFPNAIYSPYDIYCISKDSQGHLWFGSTCVGVCRFDGTNFDWFTDRLLTQAPVRSILESKSGDFWITYSGNSGNEPLKGFETIAGFPKVQNGATGTIIEGMSIVDDMNGQLWTAALSTGAVRYDGKQKTVFPILHAGTVISVFAIYKDNQGALWLGTHNGGALKFNGKTFEKFKP